MLVVPLCMHSSLARMLFSTDSRHQRYSELKEAQSTHKLRSILIYAVAHPTKAWKRSTDEALSVSASRRLFAPRAGCPTATSAIRATATIRMPAQRIALSVKCARFRETLAGAEESGSARARPLRKNIYRAVGFPRRTGLLDVS